MLHCDAPPPSPRRADPHLPQARNPCRRWGPKQAGQPRRLDQPSMPQVSVCVDFRRVLAWLQPQCSRCRTRADGVSLCVCVCCLFAIVSVVVCVAGREETRRGRSQGRHSVQFGFDLCVLCCPLLVCVDVCVLWQTIFLKHHHGTRSLDRVSGVAHVLTACSAPKRQLPLHGLLEQGARHGWIVGQRLGRGLIPGGHPGPPGLSAAAAIEWA